MSQPVEIRIQGKLAVGAEKLWESLKHFGADVVLLPGTVFEIELFNTGTWRNAPMRMQSALWVYMSDDEMRQRALTESRNTDDSLQASGTNDPKAYALSPGDDGYPGCSETVDGRPVEIDERLGPHYLDNGDLSGYCVLKPSAKYALSPSMFTECSVLGYMLAPGRSLGLLQRPEWRHMLCGFFFDELQLWGIAELASEEWQYFGWRWQVMSLDEFNEWRRSESIEIAETCRDETRKAPDDDVAPAAVMKYSINAVIQVLARNPVHRSKYSRTACNCQHWALWNLKALGFSPTWSPFNGQLQCQEEWDAAADRRKYESELRKELNVSEPSVVMMAQAN